MTVDQLVKKVADRLEENPDETRIDPVDPFDSLCWFISYHTAREVQDAYSTKDLAHVIQLGESLGGPFKTKVDIWKWIRELEDNAAEEESQAWDWLDDALDRFYGTGQYVAKKEGSNA